LVVSSETGSLDLLVEARVCGLFDLFTSEGDCNKNPHANIRPMSSPAGPRGFQPYVPASSSPAEFTVKAILIGALFGLLFGASTVYLGLRAGLTVSASIPIAVLAISVLKRLGGSTILENNIVQTIGSAGESVAGGVVFTIPALIFLTPHGPGYFNYFQIAILAFAGGILGVLMMVPLRRALIVKEHDALPYPEGTACAEVLVAGERGGRLASLVFGGLGVGALWKSLSWVFNVFVTELDYSTPRTSQFPNATLNVDISPEYMGVGYVIGPRIAGTMFAGGVLSWLVLLPLLTILGEYIPVPFPPIHPNYESNPATGMPFRISEMGPAELWSAYIRYIGAGAVLAAGLIMLARTLPTILTSAREGLKDVRLGATAASRLRTERDISTAFVLAGSLLLAIFLAVAPGAPTQGSPVASILIVVFGFLFVTVSSRITGLIGTSSNPISGMTIATLILTCLIFVALGWTGDAYAPIAIGVGAVVCIAAANAGATSQDLKTGYLVGATPSYQQIGLLIGVVTSAVVIGATTLYLHRVFGIGTTDIPAPQATLMATIIKGLLSQNLPWGLVLVGVFIAVTLELCGIHSLSFAVGLYLPIATTAPILVGGLVRGLVERRTGRTEESEVGAGTLFSSGLIAGGSLCGILYAVLVGTGRIDVPQALGRLVPSLREGPSGYLAGAGLFLALAAILARQGQKKVT
jgi:putative OPT family oligopeptide transporter